jgi:hypothetical protein
VLVVGIVYALAGFIFAALAHGAVTTQMRLAAWAISAAAFAMHIAYEQVRLGSAPVTTAFHTALAVALGAFVLALAATMRAASSSSQQHSIAIALVVWPLITGLPAFVVALIAAAVIARLRRRVDP